MVRMLQKLSFLPTKKKCVEWIFSFVVHGKPKMLSEM